MSDETEVGGQVDVGDALLAVDNALAQNAAAEQGLLLVRRMLERLVGSALGPDAEEEAETACTHPTDRRDATFGGWVCLDCGHEERAEETP